MHIPENSTFIAISSTGTDHVSRTYSDLYILLAFVGFIIGEFVLFLTISVFKARLGKRNNTKVYVIDLPPRYSEVEPPPYDWVLKHRYFEECSSKMDITSNLPTVIVICSCLALL